MTNDKSAEVIVRGLRELLPPQVDYAKLVCAEGFAHGQCYAWEDPEPYIIGEAADLIESQAAEIAELRVQLDEQGTKAAVNSEKLINEMEKYKHLYNAAEVKLAASQQETRAARNELCLKCGRYHEAHKGACDGCRWREMAK